MHRFGYYYRQPLRSEKHVFEERKFNMEQIIHATDTNFEGQEAMRQFILNRTPFFGNDDEYADRIAIQIFNDLYDAIEGKPNTKGECFHLNMLSTTCHVYFGKWWMPPQRPSSRTCHQWRYLTLTRSRYPRAIRRYKIIRKTGPGEKRRHSIESALPAFTS